MSCAGQEGLPRNRFTTWTATTLDLAFLTAGLCSRCLEIYWLSYVWDIVEVIWIARQSKDNGFLVSWPKTLSVLSFGMILQNYLALLLA